MIKEVAESSGQFEAINDFRVGLAFNYTKFLDKILTKIDGKFESKMIKEELYKKNFKVDSIIYVFV